MKGQEKQREGQEVHMKVRKYLQREGQEVQREG